MENRQIGNYNITIQETSKPLNLDKPKAIEGTIYLEEIYYCHREVHQSVKTRQSTFIIMCIWNENTDMSCK